MDAASSARTTVFIFLSSGMQELQATLSPRSGVLSPGNLVQIHRLGKALQLDTPMLSKIESPSAAQILHHRRREDLLGFRARTDARGEVHRGAEQRVAVGHRL